MVVFLTANRGIDDESGLRGHGDFDVPQLTADAIGCEIEPQHLALLEAARMGIDQLHVHGCDAVAGIVRQEEIEVGHFLANLRHGCALGDGLGGSRIDRFRYKGKRSGGGSDAIDWRKIHARQFDFLERCAIEQKQRLRGGAGALEKENAAGARARFCGMSEREQEAE